MKLSNSFIAVKKITSSVPQSQFSDDDLNRAAELIVKAEGIINPLILRRTSSQAYEVVSGDFEYYAATKAKEINNQKGEYIGAFVIEPENEEVLQEQVKLLRKRESGDDDTQQKLESLIKQVSELAESIKRIENGLNEKQKPKSTKESKTTKKTSEKSEYDSMTVPQLKTIAEERGIKTTTKMTKAKLISAITDSEKG